MDVNLKTNVNKGIEILSKLSQWLIHQVHVVSLHCHYGYVKFFSGIFNFTAPIPAKGTVSCHTHPQYDRLWNYKNSSDQQHNFLIQHNKHIQEF